MWEDKKDLIDDSVGALIPMRQREDNDFDARKFDIGEIEDYANAILKLLSDEEFYDQCSVNCRHKVEREFSTDVMLMKMEKELMSFMADKEQIQKRRKRHWL